MDSAADKRIAELLESADRRQAEHVDQVAALRDEHATQLATLHTDHATQLATLRTDHAAQLETLRNDHAAQLETLSNGHAAQLETLSNGHNVQLTALHSEHATVLATQRIEFATQLDTLRSETTARISQLQQDAETREQEMGVLMAHLQEARRPIQFIEADVKRLTEELAAKSAAVRESEEENARLRASLERTKGALEEREFLIRRLERSESNNANVLGRIQTSIERLGAVPVGSGGYSSELLGGGTATGSGHDRSAELIRVENGQPITHVLSRRTRIGRAAGCELQIDSSSVSRNHALVLVGPRETIIEDLNSTNGVLVNGRKVSRQLLSDGDAITIGEIQFRYFAKPLLAGVEADSVEPGAAQ